jgi:hypothetical protein
MTTSPLTIERQVHFQRRGPSRGKELAPGPKPPVPAPPGRVPRVARWMALALRLDRLLRDGVIASYVELARLGHVTHARVSQIMSLLNLAPDIQEQLLFLPRTERGRDAIILRDVLPIAKVLEWRKQRRLWKGPRETDT